ncbi:unnamed protein product [Schistosoma guineensis]|nr:unnamed protein product [Schistosoma intercalatum]CAH8578538.1 unnamed protein product [Schistosoma intercalatum]CAH8590456.1 unnamed protein product [Schistosoma guineensis]CAH8594840.1 unnamed protein product [Schistosoma curassoni]
MSRSSKEDWVCSDPKCKNVNFAKRDKCNRCDKPRKFVASGNAGLEVGKQLAEKSKGLFSPDDWICKTCGNINWARRSTCNVCNGSKVDIQGERTGYGGGFMERDEVVEYRERRDSDDEFDEFGRKKKSFRKNQSEQSSNHDSSNLGNNSVTRVHDKDDEDENGNNKGDDSEDEDSGDDADLSKYDIWGAGNNDSDDELSNQRKPASSQEAAKNKSRSHSHSSSSDSDSDSSSSSSQTSHSSHSDSSSSSHSEASSKLENQSNSKRSHPNNGNADNDSDNSTRVNHKRKKQ